MVRALGEGVGGALKAFSVSAPYKYFAFISYSRKDSRAAAWLQKRLEWFRFPVKLVPESQRPPNPRYVRPIYRDKTNLEVTDEHYWQNIRRALEESRYLIVLASPHSAKSTPVDMEVSHFLASHEQQSKLVVPVILGGSVTGDGGDAALCPTLREFGETITSRNLPTMVSDSDTAERDAWEQGFVALISYLLRLDRSAVGDHIQSETRKQARVLRRWLASVAALTVLAIVAGWKAKVSSDLAIVRQGIAEMKTKEVEDAKAHQDELLRKAAAADLAAYFRSREDPSKRSEALAYLQRALGYTPGDSQLIASVLGNEFPSASESFAPRFSYLFDGPVKTLAFSPDGSSIAVGSQDKSLRLIDSTSGDMLWRVEFDGEINTLAFSPDGSSVAAGSNDTSMRLFESKSGRLRWRVPRFDSGLSKLLGDPDKDDWILTLAFSPDGSFIAAGSRGASLRLFEAASGKLRWATKYDSPVLNLAFAPNSSSIAASSMDKSLRIFDSNSGTLLWRNEFDGEIHALAFSPDGSSIAAGPKGNSLSLFDLFSGKLLWSAESDGEINILSFSPDGSSIAAGSGNVFGVVGRSLSVFASDSGKLLWRNESSKPIDTIAFSPDGSSLVAGALGDSLRLFDSTSGNLLWRSDLDSVNTLAFSPDGSSIAAGSYDNSLRLFATNPDKNIWRMDVDSPVYNLAFSPVGTSIAAVSGNTEIGKHGDNTLNLYESSSGSLLWRTEIENIVNALAFSPDGTFIASGSGDSVNSSDSELSFFEASSGKLLWRVKFDSEVNILVFSPDGSSIATCSDDNYLRLFDAPSGKLLWRLRFGANLKTIAFSPDGSSIATGTEDNFMRVLTASAGKQLWRVKFNSFVSTLAFSPDGCSIAAGSWDHSLCVFDATSGKLLWRTEFGDIVDNLAFSPKSLSAIAASSRDNSVCLFDSTSGQSLWRAELDEPAKILVFSPNGTTIAASSKDNYMSLLDAASGKLLWCTNVGTSLGALAFSPGGAEIAAGTWGNSLQLFDISPFLPQKTSPPNRADGVFLAHSLRSLALAEFDSCGDLVFVKSREWQESTDIARMHGANRMFNHRLSWLKRSPRERTISPNSRILLRDHVSDNLRLAENEATIINNHARAPWHPLAPASLARLPRNNEFPQRTEYLCKLTIVRLKEADVELWKKGNLANDAAYAAMWMSKLGHPELAKQTAEFAITLVPQHELAESILKQISEK